MFYLIVFYIIFVPWNPVSFLTRDRKEMDPDAKGGEEELGGLEGRERESRIYYMRNICFNKRETLRRNKKSEQGNRSRRPKAEE